MPDITYLYMETDLKLREVAVSNIKPFFTELLAANVYQGHLLIKGDSSMKVCFDLKSGTAHLVDGSNTKSVHSFYGQGFQEKYAGPVRIAIQEVGISLVTKRSSR